MALKRTKPGEIFDLSPLGSRLRETKTSAIDKTDTFEAIRLIVPAGTEIPAHEVTGTITLHCLEGRVALGLEHSTIEMKAGDWLYLEGGESHSVRGLEDSALLLTILFDR